MARATAKSVKPTPIVVHEIEQEALPKVGDLMRFQQGEHVIHVAGKVKQKCVIIKCFLFNSERAQSGHRYYLLEEGAKPRDAFVGRDTDMRKVKPEKPAKEGNGTE